MFCFFSFMNYSLEQVKEFLRQYMKEKGLGKYMLMQDPLTPYYEAVWVGLVEDMMVMRSVRQTWERSRARVLHRRGNRSSNRGKERP
ncbi:hypothetical protein MLD38_000027 [Melastoma candidum]|uniref:Uncharacterized protein n=1 Tax=Melastoma candidum TaxID=119954 RepID=A0ACB9SHD7_9MYRT|nr:hypothetical protein MLD38_000027 [Melastoma candidum]